MRDEPFHIFELTNSASSATAEVTSENRPVGVVSWSRPARPTTAASIRAPASRSSLNSERRSRPWHRRSPHKTQSRQLQRACRRPRPHSPDRSRRDPRRYALGQSTSCGGSARSHTRAKSHKHTHRLDPFSLDCPRRHNHKEARPTRACSARRTRPGTRRLRYRPGAASNTSRHASAACNRVAASSSVKARQRSTPNKQGVDVSDWSLARFFTGPGGAIIIVPFLP